MDKKRLDDFSIYSIDTRQIIGGSEYVLTKQRVKYYDEEGYYGYTVSDDGCVTQWVLLDSGEIKHCPTVC